MSISVKQAGATLSGGFRKAAGLAGNNKAIIGASFLLGTTALTTPLLAFPLTALALGITYGVLLDKTSDIALDNINAVGRQKKISGLQLGIIAGGLHTISEFLFAANTLWKGTPELGVTNIVGGTFAHSMLILGVATAIAGSNKSSPGWKFNTAVMAGASALFGAQLLTGGFWNVPVAGVNVPITGLAMMGYGGYYLWQRVKSGEIHDHSHGHGHGHDHHDHKHEEHDHGHCDHDHGHDHERKPETPEPKKAGAWKNGAAAGISLLGLAFLSHAFVRDAVAFSEMHNVSRALIGLAGTSIGTALPEAIVTWKAARQKNTDFALGTVLGCNTTNTLIVGGMLAAASAFMSVPIPQELRPGTPTGNLTFGMFAGSTALAAAALYAGKGTLKRWQGYAAAAIYAGYFAAYGALNQGKLPELHHHGERAPAAITAPAPLTAQRPNLPKLSAG